MNERGQYGNVEADASRRDPDKSSKSSKDSSLSGLIIPGAIFAGVAIIFGRFAVREAREMKGVERELRRGREQQKLLDLPDREFDVRAREIGLREGMSQPEHARALDAYIAKKRPH